MVKLHREYRRHCLYFDASANYNFVLEMLVLLCMAATAAMVGSITFIILTEQEKTLYESQYDLISDGAIKSLARSLQISKSTGLTLASSYGSMFPDAALWPNVTMTDYSTIAGHLEDITHPIFMSFHPMVTPSQAPGFVDWAYKVFESDPTLPNTTAQHSFGRGIYKFDFASGAPDGRAPDDGTTTWGSKYQVLFPIMNTVGIESIDVEQFLLLNPHSTLSNGIAMDNVIDCATERADLKDLSVDCSSFSEIYDATGFDGFDPEVLFFQPIYPARNRTTLVGMTAVAIMWSTLLGASVPNGAPPLNAVVQSGDGFYTWCIEEGKATFVGKGDLSEKGMGAYKKTQSVATASFGSRAVTVKYEISIYPTEAFFDHYRSDLPLNATISGLAIIAFTTAVFMVFAYCTRLLATRKAAELDKKRVFVRFISHEVRTPLNAVMMSLQLLEAGMSNMKKTFRDPSRSSENRIAAVRKQLSEWNSLLSDVRVGCESGALVLDDLLHYDTAHFETSVLDVQQIPAWRLLHDQLHAFHSHAKQSGVELRIDLERWNTTLDDTKQHRIKHLFFLGDPVRIRRVLRVLVSSALKYSPEGSQVVVNVSWEQESNKIKNDKNPISAKLRSGRVSPESTMASSHPLSDIESGTIRISVRDAGNGMSEEELEKIRREGIRFDIDHLNVGESIALNQEVAATFVKQHNGTMSVQSEGKGKGSTFVVELPVFLKASHLSPLGIGDVRSSSSDISRKAIRKTSCSLHQFSVSAQKLSNDFPVTSNDAAVVSHPLHGSSPTVPSITEADVEQDIESGVGAAGAAGGGCETRVGEGEEGREIGKSAQRDAREGKGGKGRKKSGAVEHGIPAELSPSISRSISALVPALPAPKRALVVDDQISNRKLLMRLLTLKGFECTLARDGQEAVDAYIKETDKLASAAEAAEASETVAATTDDAFQLICMDFEMPVMDGPTATKLLRERGCRCLIVGVTGNVMQADRKHFIDQGANLVLPKPLQMLDLMQAWENRAALLRHLYGHDPSNLSADPLSEPQTAEPGIDMEDRLPPEEQGLLLSELKVNPAIAAAAVSSAGQQPTHNDIEANFGGAELKSASFRFNQLTAAADGGDRAQGYSDSSTIGSKSSSSVIGHSDEPRFYGRAQEHASDALQKKGKVGKDAGRKLDGWGDPRDSDSDSAGDAASVSATSKHALLSAISAGRSDTCNSDTGIGGTLRGGDRGRAAVRETGREGRQSEAEAEAEAEVEVEVERLVAVAGLAEMGGVGEGERRKGSEYDQKRVRELAPLRAALKGGLRGGAGAATATGAAGGSKVERDGAPFTVGAGQCSGERRGGVLENERGKRDFFGEKEDEDTHSPQQCEK